MRFRAALLALTVAAAGCGSTGDSGDPTGLPGSGTLESLFEKPGENVGLINGTSDFAPGEIRLSFLVVDGDGRVIARPSANVYVAYGLKGKPFLRTEARLEQVGVAGTSGAAIGDVTELYVAKLELSKPGTYWVLAEPVGGKAIQAVGNVVVRKRSRSPAVGERAFPSRTPTLRSTKGDLASLTTQTPPDLGLLRYSVAESVAAHVPFVVVFATPKFCTSRACGPVVDVVDSVRRQLEGKGVRFIHVEIYRDNDPAKGTNRWVREWKLPTEPWVFLVGSDGRIAAKFEGSVSVHELKAAVEKLLVGKA